MGCGSRFFHTGVLYANGKPFIYVFDCGSKGNAKTPSQDSKTTIKEEINTFIESLAHYWTPENRPYWRYWRRSHPIYLHPYDEGVTFIGTPFQDEWLSLNYIEQTIKPTIDIIYIFHFDDDHINGLNYLIQKGNVSEVAIPYASPAERFYLPTTLNLKRIRRTTNSRPSQHKRFHPTICCKSARRISAASRRDHTQTV